MAVMKCKMCGGDLILTEGQSVAECEYCGTKQTLPKLNDDRRANLYDRANHFRRSNEFDKAMGMYERILSEDTTDAEAYWSLVLCRYGIEYVEDPATHKRLPTVNRAQYTSIFDDDNYKSALQYADSYQRHIYEEEAKAINEIQKGILAISQKEEPFDVFICYKETDRNGRRTPDSVLANDLYHQLTQEGFKVFFSRITLEDKLGVAYEPYIFAALNSARVMVVVGTKPEYFNAVWVKNEWSRYLSLIKNGAKKILIPAYRDMDPYDLPEEFSHLQAQDMGKLGFMQDLIRGIKKLAKTEEPKTTVVKETVIAGTAANTAPLLKRAFMFLEDGEWESADEYCEKVLDIDPECARAYLAKLMAELKVFKLEDLRDQKAPFDDRNNYKKVLRFADESLKASMVGYIDYINTRNANERLETAYNYSKRLMTNAGTENAYKIAAHSFESIPNYKDSSALAQECYQKAEDARKNAILAEGKIKMASGTILGYDRALALFITIPGWKDADQNISVCQEKIASLRAAKEAERLAQKRKAEEERLERVRKAEEERLASEQRAEIFRQEAAKYAKHQKKIAIIIATATSLFAVMIVSLIMLILPSSNYQKGEELMAAGDTTGAAMAFGAAGNWKDAQERSFALWEQIVLWETISSSTDHTVGLRSDGTVVAVGNNEDGQCDVSGWANIVAISTGYHYTVGLRSDGTVVAVGNNEDGQCDVSGWRNIVAISAGFNHTVGLCSDGTMVAVGENKDGRCNVGSKTDIVAISAGNDVTVGLRSDGTVVAVGDNKDGQCDVDNWTDIVAISACSSHTVGLRSDGTVVTVGWNYYGQCDVGDWTDIVAISAGQFHTLGLRSDGTVVAVGDNDYGRCNVNGWTDIVALSTDWFNSVGLRSDGTVVAVGYNDNGQCDVSGWANIKLPNLE